MKFVKVLGLAGASMLLVIAQEQAGNQTFRIPDGWTRTNQPGSTILSPSAEPKNMVVILLAERPFAGDFRAAFDHDVKGMNGDLRTISAGEVKSIRTREGFDLLNTTYNLQAANGAKSLRYYQAANVQGRLEIVTYLAANTALFQKYTPTLVQFLSTLSYGGSPPAPANPAPATPPTDVPAAEPPASSLPPNRLDGIYRGYKYNYVTVLGVVQKKAVFDYYSFFPNGTVYWGLPPTGLAGFNMARACQGKMDFCGNYQLSGDQITIVVNGGTYRQTGSYIPGRIQIGDRPYTLQGDPSKSAAHMLEGDFGRADAQPGEDLARKFIRFTRDGHFIDQGIVTTVCGADYSTGKLVFERPAGSGTYTLAPYTIILRYSDGYQRQIAVTIEPADMQKTTLTQLLVNTYTLVRRR